MITEYGDLTSEEDESDMDLDENMKWIYEVEGISVSDGLKYCGMPQQFVKFLNSFYDTLDDKSKEIEEAYNNGDLTLYTIKVHALKSTSRIIGASELSGLAEELEKAGNDGDVERINKDTDRLLHMYRGYKDKLSKIKTAEDEGDQNKPRISEAELKNAYNAIAEFVTQMDYDAVEMVLNELKEYNIPPEDKEKVDKVEKLLKTFDWDALEKMFGIE